VIQESISHKGFLHKKVVIIGAGPAGLTAAYNLSEANINVCVLEQGQMVGGLAKTISYKGYYFDIGGHRFHTTIGRIKDFWAKILGEDFLRRQRFSRIYYQKQFFDYPLKPFQTMFQLGTRNGVSIIASYLASHLFPAYPEDSFEKWVSNRFGNRLYRIFFREYTEKVLGIPGNEIRAEWAAERIKGLSLFHAVMTALLKPLRKNGKGTAIKTLIDSFDYPKLGPGMMWQAVAGILREKGVRVSMNAKVDKICWSKDTIDALEFTQNGTCLSAVGTDFLSSMPMKDLIQTLSPEAPVEVQRAAERLKYRDFITVALIINKRDVFPDNWLYINDPRIRLGRIQNFKNWSPFMVPDQEKTCLGLEYFCFEGDGLWNLPDQELIVLGKEELAKLGLVKADEVEDGTVVRKQKAYPLYDTASWESVSIIRNFLHRFKNLQLIGRNGMHRYNNQDHSMLTAMLAVENILGDNHNLWELDS